MRSRKRTPSAQGVCGRKAHSNAHLLCGLLTGSKRPKRTVSAQQLCFARARVCVRGSLGREPKKAVRFFPAALARRSRPERHKPCVTKNWRSYEHAQTPHPRKIESDLRAKGLRQTRLRLMRNHVGAVIVQVEVASDHRPVQIDVRIYPSNSPEREHAVWTKALEHLCRDVIKANAGEPAGPERITKHPNIQPDNPAAN